MANVKPTYVSASNGLPQPVDTSTDSVSANAVYVQTSATPDTNVGISRDVSNNLVLTDPVTGSKTLADLTGPNDWTEAVSTAAPNVTVPATSWTPSNGATDVDAVVRPKGNGALLGQVPDATAAGGNKRGAYATDFQRLRTDPTQVASGSYSVLGGGLNNKVVGDESVVAGGNNNANTTGNYAVIAGGANQQALANYATIGGGVGHIVSAPYCTVAGGNTNVAAAAVGGATVGGGGGNFAFADHATVAGGLSNIVTGIGAAVGGGQNSVVTGEYAAVAGGQSLYASSLSEAVVGQFNVDSLGDATNFVGTDPVFSVGNGTGAGAESNAIIVLKDGSLGVNLVAAKPTEKLDVAGNVKFSGALMPNNAAGTAGQVLTSAGAGSPPVWAAAGGGLTNWTEAVSTSAPNATVPVTSFTATNAATNVDAALVAKGTGATLADIPDGTAAGGNKRGIYATDWQKARSAAAQVASGIYGVIGGGQDNLANADHTTIGGGFGNQATAIRATVAGGYGNVANGASGTVGGGFQNSANAGGTVGGGSGNQAAPAATVAGGSANTATNNWATIGGGQTNIASGQHATVGGGQGNNASATHATIGGGTNNIANATFAVVAGGSNNTAGNGAFVGGGQGNSAVTSAAAVCGQGNSAAGQYSFIGSGANLSAGGTGSGIISGINITTRGIRGRYVFGAGSFAAAIGKTQAGINVTYRQTTTNTPTTLTADGAAPIPSAVNVLPDNSAYGIRCTVVARDNAGTTAAWEIGGLVKRNAGAATTAVVGAPAVTSLGADAGAAAWTVALVADTTYGAAVIQVTDGTGTPTTVDWVATMHTTEIAL